MFRRTPLLPVPTEAMLSVPHPVPARVLHEGISLDESYHLMMQTSLLSLGGSSSKKTCRIAYVKAKDEKGKPIPSHPFQVQLKEQEGRGVFQSRRVLIYDARRGTPIGIIAGRLREVYTFSANVRGQVANLKRQKYQGFDLFQFAACKEDRWKQKTFMATVHGDEYVLEPVGLSRRQEEMHVTRNGTVCMYMKKHHIGDFWTGSRHWELKISPGIDPVLMIALMAIKDEFDDAERRRRIAERRRRSD